MKNAKRLVSLLVAVMLIASIGVAALAAPAPTTYTITLNGTEEGQAFRVAKIFDLTYSGTANAYTIADGWADFFAAGGAGAAYIVDSNNAAGELNRITVGSATKYINITDDNVAEFSVKARAYAEANWASLPTAGKTEVNAAAAPETSTTITVGTPGYWMVYCTTDGYTDTKPGYSTVVTLTNVRPTVDAEMKAQIPGTPVKDFTDFDNKADQDGRQIGDVVGFIVDNAEVAISVNEEWHYQVFGDTMGTGLTFNNDLRIRLIPPGSPAVPVELAIGTDIKVVDWAVLNPTSGTINTTNFGTYGAVAYNPATNPSAFLIYLDTKALNEGTVDYHGYTIELTYSATINSEAGNTITNELTYGNDGTYDDPSKPLNPIPHPPVSKVQTWVNKVSVDKIIAGTEKIGAAAVPAYDYANNTMTENGTVPANTSITLTGVTQTVGGVVYVQIKYGTGTNETTTYIRADDYTGDKLAGAKFVLFRTSYQAVKTNKANVVLYSNYDPETTSSVTVADMNTPLELVGSASVTTYDTSTNPVTETTTAWHKVKYQGVEYFVKAADTGAEETISNVKEYYRLAGGKITWVENVNDATELTTSTTAMIEFNGLADGTYYLEETEAPDGYNKLPQPIQVVLAHTTNNGDGVGVNVVVPVANTTGNPLPSTGGIGTTIFYVLGGILLVGASVLLVTRRRVSSMN